MKPLVDTSRLKAVATVVMASALSCGASIAIADEQPNNATGYLGDYSTPNLGGFELGVSLTDEERDVPRLTPGATAGFEPAGASGDDRISVGARFTETFDEYTFSVSAGVALDEFEGDSRSSFLAGAGVEFGGFELRGTFESQPRTSVGDGEGFDRFSVGGTYEAGPWLLGLSYDVQALAETDFGEETERRVFSFGGEYIFDDRLTAGVSVQWGETECARIDCPDQSSFGGGLLLGIVF